MGEQEHVPPGGAPVAPVPGWYLDPREPGQLRFWDGRGWSDQVAVRPAEAQVPPGAGAGVGAGSGHRSSVGPVFYGALALLLVALVFVVLAVLPHGGAGSGDDNRPYAIGGCRYFVAARLQNPAAVEFDDLETIAPVSGDQWTVTGAVTSQTTVGAERRQLFTCTVDLPSASQWRLVSLRFLEP